MIKKMLMAAALLSVTACSAIQIPPERLERNEAGIRSAEELGAQNVPEAKLHLQMAKDETEQAKKLAQKGDDRAVLVLARAESDSELAMALAREAAVHAEAAKAAEDLKAVRTRGNQ